MKGYREFLESKIETAPVSGIEIDGEEINKALKPHQRDAVLWAISGGRRALFESFGLGKTIQEIEYCHQILRHEGYYRDAVGYLEAAEEEIDAPTLLELL